MLAALKRVIAKIVFFLMGVDRNGANLDVRFYQILNFYFGKWVPSLKSIAETTAIRDAEVTPSIPQALKYENWLSREAPQLKTRLYKFINSLDSLSVEDRSHLMPAICWLIENCTKDSAFPMRTKYSNYLSFSQEGEDLILKEIFSKSPTGFYVDIGAHHPFRFSNTAALSMRGWTGINIDPTPGVKEIFERYRPKDINLDIALGEQEGSLQFYQFDEPALNTFDGERAQFLQNETHYKLIATKDVSIQRLESVFKKHLPTGQAIDFMSIDVEGWEFKILSSNDWNQFRPKFILIELLSSSRSLEESSNNVLQMLQSLDYEVKSKSFRNYLLEDTRK